MKRDIKGCTLVEMIMIMAIITVVIVSAMSFYQRAKQAIYAKEKNYVKQFMIQGENPFVIKTIPPQNIEKYQKEIIKENELAVAAGKEDPIPTSDDYVRPVQQSVTTPVSQPVVIVAAPVVPAPVIEQITENHYHFEKLTTALKYIGLGVLGLISLFGLFKLMIYAKQTLIVKSAVRNSKKMVDNFDTNFDENKNYLPLLRNLSDQVIINAVLIETRKNKDSVLNLIVNNEQLKTRLNLIESSLMSKVA